MLSRKAYPFADLPEFVGAGIYAIYYTGDFQAYALIAERNQGGRFEVPIYVGKAIPAGARKGKFGLNLKSGGALWKRLKEHAESIRIASNLNLKDFHCRFLVVDGIWIPLGESLLIAKFSPVWNTLIDGFGNHDPGSRRYAGLRPRWDVLHPGRPWAAKCQDRAETAKQILLEIHHFLEAKPLPSSHPSVFGENGA